MNVGSSGIITRSALPSGSSFFTSSITCAPLLLAFFSASKRECDNYTKATITRVITVFFQIFKKLSHMFQVIWVYCDIMDINFFIILSNLISFFLDLFNLYKLLFVLSGWICLDNHTYFVCVGGGEINFVFVYMSVSRSNNF